MTQTKSYAAKSATEKLAPHEFQRRDVGENDIQINIEYCGVCHSDIHTARNEWGNTTYPIVPGHEIVGKITKLGSNVKNFKEGERVGVGCLVGSCKKCDACSNHLEQYCENGWIGTYNGQDKDGTITQGGYSNNIVVNQDFVLKVSEKLDPKAVAPLLCAGITTYSPLKNWNVQKGQKVGIVGLGGLGHMGLKFAHSFGAHTVQFTRSKNKIEDAKRLGADEVILSTDENQLKEHQGTFDFILDTVSANHDIDQLLSMLKQDGHLVLVGAPPEAQKVSPFSLIFKRRSFSGSLIGGIKQTQEMLDYCAEHNITSDIELISIDKINEAYERTLNSDVKYRFVIDMSTLDA